MSQKVGPEIEFTLPVMTEKEKQKLAAARIGKTTRRCADEKHCAGNDDWHCRRATENQHPKKIWAQTETQLRQFYPHKGVGYYCSLFGRSRQGWYEQTKREDEQHRLMPSCWSWCQDLPRAGVPKLHFMLQEKLREHGIKTGRDALYKLLGEHGYLIRYRRRKPYTTDSNHPYKKYPNLIRNITYLTHPVSSGWATLPTSGWKKNLVI
jgi:hypothetical protein